MDAVLVGVLDAVIDAVGVGVSERGIGLAGVDDAVLVGVFDAVLDGVGVGVCTQRVGLAGVQGSVLVGILHTVQDSVIIGVVVGAVGLARVLDTVAVRVLDAVGEAVIVGVGVEEVGRAVGVGVDVVATFDGGRDAIAVVVGIRIVGVEVGRDAVRVGVRVALGHGVGAVSVVVGVDVVGIGVVIVVGQGRCGAAVVGVPGVVEAVAIGVGAGRCDVCSAVAFYVIGLDGVGHAIAVGVGLEVVRSGIAVGVVRALGRGGNAVAVIVDVEVVGDPVAVGVVVVAVGTRVDVFLDIRDAVAVAVACAAGCCELEAEGLLGLGARERPVRGGARLHGAGAEQLSSILDGVALGDCEGIEVPVCVARDLGRSAILVGVGTTDAVTVCIDTVAADVVGSGMDGLVRVVAVHVADEAPHSVAVAVAVEVVEDLHLVEDGGGVELGGEDDADAGVLAFAGGCEARRGRVVAMPGTEWTVFGLPGEAVVTAAHVEVDRRTVFHRLLPRELVPQRVGAGIHRICQRDERAGVLEGRVVRLAARQQRRGERATEGGAAGLVGRVLEAERDDIATRLGICDPQRLGTIATGAGQTRPPRGFPGTRDIGPVACSRSDVGVEHGDGHGDCSAIRVDPVDRVGGRSASRAMCDQGEALGVGQGIGQRDLGAVSEGRLPGSARGLRADSVGHTVDLKGLGRVESGVVCYFEAGIPGGELLVVVLLKLNRPADLVPRTPIPGRRVVEGGELAQAEARVEVVGGTPFEVGPNARGLTCKGDGGDHRQKQGRS